VDTYPLAAAAPAALPDRAPPTVVSRYPGDGGSATSSSSRITATLSEDVDPASVRAQLVDGAGKQVPADVDYNPAARTVVLTPQDSVAAGTYKVTVSNAKDATGNVMAPVVLENVDRESAIAHDELFGPVVLLMEFGDADGTVDWHQGIEFYNFARRAGKQDFVLLVYPGEDHGLRKKENQIDYHRRILQWFGHWLKGEPEPDWFEKGVSWLERKRILEGSKQ